MAPASKKEKSPATHSVRPNYLVDQVLTELRKSLREERYKPGDKLPSESHLAQEYGVGRSTIREALRVLAHLGLVETWSGRGSFVAEGRPRDAEKPPRLDLDDLKDIYDFRYNLEMEAAERAALKRTNDHVKKLKSHLARAKQGLAAGNLDACVAADTDFHVTILEAGGCHFAASIYRAHRAEFEQAEKAVISATGLLSSDSAVAAIESLHDELLDAIIRQDARDALACVRRDRREVETLLRLRSS